MLEKTIRWGGNSEKASSGMNAARTAAQIKLNLKDSVEEFYKYVNTRPTLDFRIQYRTGLMFTVSCAQTGTPSPLATVSPTKSWLTS